MREPTRLTRIDGKRPDGVTSLPYCRGRSVVWDVSIVHTLAPSYLDASSKRAGAAAEQRASAKRAKYVDFAPTYDFVPLIFETMGPLASETKVFLDGLAQRLRWATGDLRAGDFFYQRLSLAVQRGNAVCVLASLSD